MRLHHGVWLAVLSLAIRVGALLGPPAWAVDLLPPPDPPRATLITVGTSDAAGTVAVTGAAGAVPGGRPVLALNLRTGHYGLTTAGADGRFATSLTAPSGSFISVRYDPFGQTFSPQNLQADNGYPITATPSTTLYVRPAPAGPGVTAFGDDGVFMKGGAAWFQVQGTISTLAAAPGGPVTIEGTLRITSPGIGPTFDPRGLTASANVSLDRLFDEAGRQQQAKYQFMSRLLTPTGLPIERFFPGPPPFGDELPLGAFTLAGPNTIQATFRRTITLPPTLLAGWYSPSINLDLPLGVPNPDAASSGLAPGVEQKFFGPNQARLPLLKVGAPAAPRLVWTLLTDTPSQGTRGAVAQEDLPTFQIASRIIHNSDTYIVPRDDPRTGQRIAYRLEPFVPLLAQSDREPIAPAIPLQFPSGSLMVSVTQPDGTPVALGTAPFAQSRSSSPVTTDGTLLDFGGGAMADLLQLTTLSDRFLFRFAQYGRHLVTLSGTVQDIWGNAYSGSGTYEVFVARPLELGSGAFPTTPFAVGDTLSPVVTVMPPVPADVTVRLRLAPNGDATRLIDRRVTGRANAFGYFHPGATATRLSLDQPGEYRVDVIAQYTDAQGVLWMGSRTWGSVVETPSGMLIAHGRRGIDEAPAIGQQWFTRRSTGIPNAGNHIQYPFNSGDILWASDTGPGQDTDSATAVISAQDTTGAVTRIVQARGQFVNVAPPGDLQTRITAGEMPLFTSTPTGVNAAYDPTQIDQWGYTYRSAERPDMSVREIISEDMLPGPYWRFDEIYAVQPGVGTNGDLQNEIKFQFGGVVFRDRTSGINQFAGYGSLFVLVPSTDPVGSRVFPPFQGNGGGPSGGPIMTLKGRPIDLFLVPRGVTPGSVLTVGDTFSFSGQVGPPLPSKVQVVVTDPAGMQRTINGTATRVGYFYRPDSDFVLTQPGLYTVRVTVTHDGLTSAGQVTPPFPAGTVLGSDDGTFQVYVVPLGTPALTVDAARDRFITPGGTVTVTGSVPAGLQGATASVTAAMPGFLLQQGAVPVQSGAFRYTYDPVALNRDFPNLDIRELGNRPASVDVVTLSFLVTGRDASGATVASANKLYLREDELLNLSVGAAAAAGTSATITTNKSAYRTGDTLTVSVAVTNAGAARAVDGYVGVQLADGRTTLYFTGAGFIPTQTPLARAFPLASGAALGPVPVLSVTLPASIPAGPYTFLFTLTDPGNPGATVASGSAPFTFQP